MTPTELVSFNVENQVRQPTMIRMRDNEGLTWEVELFIQCLAV